MDMTRGTYGFRFAEDQDLPLCVLFAAGYDSITDPSYHWDGLERTDGPLLLFQYTFSGEGVFELGDCSHRVTAGQAFLAEIPSSHRYYYPQEAPRRLRTGAVGAHDHHRCGGRSDHRSLHRLILRLPVRHGISQNAGYIAEK